MVRLQLISLFSFAQCLILSYLHTNQLTGTILPQIGNFSKLRVLYSQNIIVLLDCGVFLFAHGRSLRYLFSNRLTGTIPVELGKLTQMAYLYSLMIHIRWFHSQLMCIFILSLSSLRYLYSNQLTGTIPPQLGNLTQLLYLYAQKSILILRRFPCADDLSSI